MVGAKTKRALFLLYNDFCLGWGDKNWVFWEDVLLSCITFYFISAFFSFPFLTLPFCRLSQFQVEICLLGLIQLHAAVCESCSYIFHILSFQFMVLYFLYFSFLVLAVDFIFSCSLIFTMHMS